MWHDSLIFDAIRSRKIWLIHVWHHSVNMTWLIRMWHDSFVCDMTHSYVTWFVHMNMPHSYVTWFVQKWIHMWHDSFMCDMTHSFVTDSFICDMTHSCVTWLIHMWHDSFICDMTHSYVTWLIHMWHDLFTRVITHSHAAQFFYTWHNSPPEQRSWETHTRFSKRHHLWSCSTGQNPLFSPVVKYTISIQHLGLLARLFWRDKHISFDQQAYESFAERA